MSKYKADTLYFAADEALNKKDYALAKLKLDEALNADPTHALSLNALGWLYERKYFEYDKAEKCYKAGLAVAPMHPSLNVNYAYLLSALDKYEDFDLLYESAIKVPGVNLARLKGERGVTLEKRGMLEEALLSYEEALAISISSEDIVLLESDIRRVKGKMESRTKS